MNNYFHKNPIVITDQFLTSISWCVRTLAFPWTLDQSIYFSEVWVKWRKGSEEGSRNCIPLCILIRIPRFPFTTREFSAFFWMNKAIRHSFKFRLLVANLVLRLAVERLKAAHASCLVRVFIVVAKITFLNVQWFYIFRWSFYDS